MPAPVASLPRTGEQIFAVKCAFCHDATGWGTRSTWLPLYGMDTMSAVRRERFLAKVERKMREP